MASSIGQDGPIPLLSRAPAYAYFCFWFKGKNETHTFGRMAKI